MFESTVRKMLIPIGFGIAFVLVACNKPTATPEGPVSEALPLCSLSDLEAPQTLYPGDYTIISETTPAFQWVTQDDCVPKGYRVQVVTYGGYDFGGLFVGEVDSGESTWIIDTPLQPATDYEWRLAARAVDGVGPYSESTRFWTGPICDPGSLAAPILNAPVDGAVITENYAILDWEYPDACVPEDYLAELKDSSDFTGTNQMSEEGISPADEQVSFSSLEDCTTYYWRVSARVGGTTSAYSEVRTLYTDFTGSCESAETETTLADTTATPADSGDRTVKALKNSNCRTGPGTVYDQYGFLLEGETALATGRLADNTWLVVQLTDRPKPCWIAANLLQFTFSPEVLSAVIPPPTPTPALGSIQGLVWHDLCAPPMHSTPTASPPEGCVALSGGGYGANGVYESGEPGIGGVIVSLGSGSCPSTGLATTTSGGSGGYSFNGLSTGTYCVSIDALSSTNSSILIPGGWTYPTSGGSAQSTVTVDPGVTVSGISFGWDYQFLP
jgi:hypothetical protein